MGRKLLRATIPHQRCGIQNGVGNRGGPQSPTSLRETVHRRMVVKFVSCETVAT